MFANRQYKPKKQMHPVRRAIRASNTAFRRAVADALEPRRLLSVLTIAQENALAGAPKSQWDISGAGDASIQGYATDISVNQGNTVQFKVDDVALAAYQIDIYRMGYYQGNGARKVATIPSTQTLKVDQPDWAQNLSTGLIDAGTWTVTASWAVPSDATSGIYFGKVVRDDTGGASHIVFIVRNDASHSDILFQTSDSTWQAYNNWGGNSLYVGSPVDRAYKVSYNRPFNTRATNPQDWVFANEYPMVRFLESNGFDVTYFTGVDAARSPSLMKNHKVYMSVGHDEYWSGEQRTALEAAIATGVNVAFFSGNEMYWKTRWETSIDGSNTPYRTLVCYKESTIDQSPGDPIPNGVTSGYNQAGIADPSPTWTGLWRDTRFSTDAKVEQTLTGQIWSVNRGQGGLFGTAIKVPAEFGKARIWRNTSVATLAAGQTATLSNGTLGYEWDEDVDSGFRPAGVIQLTSTTESVTEKLVDPVSWPGCGGQPGSLCTRCRGCMVAPGTATHSVTEHRDQNSGSLIFAAGTIQWSWGLDANHDGGTTVADSRMQQASVNVLADMGVMPSTLIAGLVAASKSTDTAGPTATITLPQNNTIITQNGDATISGTATDTGGGIVGGIEVSTDGGTTWHPATTGRASWSYTWTPGTLGATQIRVRATDDSLNTGAVTSATLTLAQGTTGASIWSNSVTPGIINDADASPIEVGVKFKSDTSGFITGLRFYKGSQNTGTHIGHLWSSTGALLATATFTNESGSGWQTITLSSPVAISANTTYVASYHTDAGHYSSNSNYFLSVGVDRAPLHALSDAAGGGNGVYHYGATAFPTDTFSAANYWVDVVFNANATSDTTAPTITAQSPASGATGIAANPLIRVTFSESIQSSTLAFILKSASGATIAASVSYDDATTTATLTPTAALALGSTYTVTVSGAKDPSGNTMVAASWSFTTIASGATLSIWQQSATPAIITADDPTSYELGTKFRSDSTGWITGLWFYKGPQNTGTHTGALWNSSGVMLASLTFTNETASGWQGATFSQPVQIASGQTYIASYHTNGNYSATLDYFTAHTADNGVLHALADGTDGANGLFYAGTNTAFPNESYRGANYWIDVQFTTALADTTPPTITARTPATGATGVANTSPITATFSESIQQATLAFALRDPSNNVVAASVAYNDATHVATLTPTAALAGNVVYTVSISGAKDAAGNAMSAISWTFTTAAVVVDTTPPNVTAFTPALGLTNVSVNTTVTTTFSESIQPSTLSLTLKNAANVTIAAAVSYNDATRTATLTPTAPLSGSTVYTVSVTGAKDAAGNTMSAFSWSFTTVAVDTTPPTVTARTPASGATGISRNSTITATFSEDIQPATLSLVLRDASNNVVTSAVSYNAATRLATLTPTAQLNAGAVYTATVSGAKDAAGNAMASTSWSFTTIAVDTTPPTITARTPAANATNVSRAVKPTITFSEPMLASSISGSTIKLTLGSATVNATVSYNATTRVATISPATTLNLLARYTISVTGGSAGVKDVAGNALAATTSWTFTTSLFSLRVPETSVPDTGADGGDASASIAGIDPNVNRDGDLGGGGDGSLPPIIA